MRKINEFLDKNISKILTTFIVLQPILDLISGLNNNLINIPFNINQIIRILFLLFGIFYLLFICNTKYKKYNNLYLIILTLYFLNFILSIIVYKDINILFYELKNAILFFYFPLTLIIFINIFEQYKINFNTKYLVVVFSIYIFFIFFPNLTNLSFNSYLEGKLGSSGWFNSANATSSIISLLTPIIIVYFKDKKFNILTLLIIIMFLYSIFTIGTKVPFLSLIIIVLANIIYLIKILYDKKEFKKIKLIILSFLIILLSSILVLPKTNFYRNIQIHLNYLGVENKLEIITNIDVIDRFIFSDRLSFLTKTKEVYDNSNIIQKLIGIGYIENYSTDNASTKIIEIDYYDIYYRHGIIGFTIFFIPLILVTYKIVSKKQTNPFININLSIVVILIYLLSLFSGHILTVPNVSIIVALLLCINIFSNKVKFN